MISCESPSCLCSPLVNTSASYLYYSCTVLMNIRCAVELTVRLPHGCLNFMKLCGTSGPLVSNGMIAAFTNTECTDVHFVCGLCCGSARGIVEEYQQHIQNWRNPSGQEVAIAYIEQEWCPCKTLCATAQDNISLQFIVELKLNCTLYARCPDLCSFMSNSFRLT